MFTITHSRSFAGPAEPCYCSADPEHLVTGLKFEPLLPMLCVVACTEREASGCTTYCNVPRQTPSPALPTTHGSTTTYAMLMCQSSKGACIGLRTHSKIVLCSVQTQLQKGVAVRAYVRVVESWM